LRIKLLWPKEAKSHQDLGSQAREHRFAMPQKQQQWQQRQQQWGQQQWGQQQWEQQQWQQWEQQQKQQKQQKQQRQRQQQQWQQQGGQPPRRQGWPQQGRQRSWSRWRPTLRFDLNDRVVCDLGVRWAAGHVVGSDPDYNDDWCYLVKLEPHPGLEGRTICVPQDTENVCFQEVCFSPQQMDLIKGAAPELPKTGSKLALRFAQGDRVTCRVRHGADFLENWCSGEVDAEYPPLPEPLQWGEEAGAAEAYPSSVAYRVKLDQGGVVYCHADNYTLIRREGLEPQTRVKGVSKRMEDRKNPDGALVRFDHMTERDKRLNLPSSDTAGAAADLTLEQRKALFLE